MTEQTFRKHIPALILLLALGVAAGCAHAGSPVSTARTTPGKELPQPPSEERELLRAEMLLQEGDTLSSSMIFQRLDQPANAPDIRLRARYGLAVASLLSAQDFVSFNKALNLWRGWTAEADEGQCDPGLLEPVLSRLAMTLPGSEASTMEMADYQPEGVSGQLPGYEEFIPRLEGQFEARDQIEDLKRQLAWSERERNRLSDELKAQLNDTIRRNLDLSDENLTLSLENQRLRERQLALSMENERLRQQLKALEQLHLEITRKKKVVE